MKDGALWSEITVPEDSPYITDGFLCPEMMVEIMAQCFAAAAGAREGYLAAVSRFRTFAKARPGDRLLIKCEKLRALGGLWLLKGSVERLSEPAGLAAEAEFKAHVRNDDE